ncbi:MAG TPA: sodium:solute symporter [Saprospiraceae bacterium]|nr:sodium:solute symporter [Saprospiraceae bacterium]
MEVLTPKLILGIVAIYFLVLMIISYLTGKEADNDSFFRANKKSPWFLVAFGMVGASLSGVTFISIPGVVGAHGLNQGFSYMQVVFGYLLGYLVIATILLPLYYRLNLTSIYTFLEKRLGFFSYKTGAAYFLVSRILGASFRLYLVAIVLQKFVLAQLGVPFWLTVLMTILLIWVYTFKAGIKTIVWTDTLQTTCMLLAVGLTIYAIGHAMGMSLGELISLVRNSEYAQMFYFEGGWSDPNNFFKQFISGALIAIVMTGLDQDMMQKNLTCKSLRHAQMNVASFSIVLIFANLLFLTLGALLYIYASNIGLEIPTKTDQLFPTIALQHLSPMIGVIFILGLIAAAYSSADSALTALTTSFCIDFLDFEKKEKMTAPEELKRTRFFVHIGFSVLLFSVIIAFNAINNTAVINGLFKAAGYTYGPILALFTFGMFTTRLVNDKLVLYICLAAPILAFILDKYDLFIGFKLGFLILLVNAALTFIGLWFISKAKPEDAENE